MTDFFGKKEPIFPAKEVKTPDFSTFVSFDLETTGLEENSHIIEVGAVKVVNGKITAAFNELVDPGVLIPPEITRLTGISDEAVYGADEIEKVLPRFREFAGANILVGHNAISFDCKIMRHWAEEYGIYIPNDVFDTLKYVKFRCEPLPGLLDHRLATLCDYFGIVADRYHRASSDAEVTAKLYLALQSSAKPKSKA